MLVSLTVGKVDAGVAVLLTEDNRLIEFPSVLLPNNITSGSIVDITVARNKSAETESASTFQSLQKRILNTYGVKSPTAPVLRLRNATQTAVVLEWDAIDLATASLRSLSLYRNDAKAGSIPRPRDTTSTKISGLAIDTEYTFHLVLRTSAGTYTSQKLVCRTHKMTDLSGITITPGIMPADLKESLATAVDRIGGKLIDTVRIDTTHFVCTEGRGLAWEKAVEMNIPVVRPEWVEGCEREGTIVSVRGYYLNADPKSRQIGPGVGAQQSRDNTILSAESPSSPSTQRQKVPPKIDATERGDVEKPMVTPFPGAQPHNGTTAEEEDDDDDDDTAPESPPPPPPKDGDESGQQRSDNMSKSDTQSVGGDDDDGTSSDDSEPSTVVRKPIDEKSDDSGRSESTDKSLPQFRQDDPKANGTKNEEMDEVPL